MKKKSTSRKAVIQLFDAEDLERYHKEIPCTCTLQFFVRENRLHMFTSMRSNDAYMGLPHDIFTFTMIQEIIARSLNVDLGEYHHAVGSLHLYKSDKIKAEGYINAGLQSTKFPMPEMPLGDPWEPIRTLLNIEFELRNGKSISIPPPEELNPYWADFACLLQIYSIFKVSKELNQISSLKENLSSKIYDTYITKRLEEKA